MSYDEQQHYPHIFQSGDNDAITCALCGKTGRSDIQRDELVALLQEKCPEHRKRRFFQNKTKYRLKYAAQLADTGKKR